VPENKRQFIVPVLGTVNRLSSSCVCRMDAAAHSSTVYRPNVHRMKGVFIMAQVEKHTRSAVHRLLGHYERTTKNPKNKDIDLSKSKYNYRLFKEREGMTDRQYYKHRISQLKLLNRADVKTLCSWVVHIPEHVKPEDEKRFFTEVLRFMATRYGSENIVSAWCHSRDEKTPHAHIAFIPSPDGKKVSAKEIINLKELTIFHDEFQKHFDSLPEPIEGAKVKTGYMKGRRNRSVKEMKKERGRLKLNDRSREQKGVFINHDREH
jgi:hypothetical protein